MIANAEAQIIGATEGSNSWGDTTLSESPSVTVPCHIGGVSGIAGMDQRTDREGMTVTRSRVRIPYGTTLPANPLFVINGERWRPVSRILTLQPQLWTVYKCERIN